MRQEIHIFHQQMGLAYSLIGPLGRIDGRMQASLSSKRGKDLLCFVQVKGGLQRFPVVERKAEPIFVSYGDQDIDAHSETFLGNSCPQRRLPPDIIDEQEKRYPEACLEAEVVADLFDLLARFGDAQYKDGV